VRIFGVDPGSHITGFGVIELQGSRVVAVEYGEIKTPADAALPKRLANIYAGLIEVLERTSPDLLAIEDIFYRKNFKSAVMIGEARGVAMLAAARSHLEVFGYPPARVKQAIVGNGRAVKYQVQMMVSRLLNLSEMPAENAADALAIALCHSHTINHCHVQLH